VKPSKPNLIGKLKNETGLIDVAWEKLTIADIEKILKFLEFLYAEIEYEAS